MNIKFQPFQKKHLALWEQWVRIPHVKDVWFIDGYHTTDSIHQRITGNGYDYPFIILVDDNPIGYIVCCDLYAYHMLCDNPKGLFIAESPGTFCMDLFIAAEDYLNKGYGTEIVKLFSEYIFTNFNAEKIFIDPAVTNKRAIRCYEKAGFIFVKQAYDGVTNCYVMRKNKA